MEETQIKTGTVVAFIELKNARGYPLTGEITAIEPNNQFSVKAWGLDGPGSETNIHGVPMDAIRPV